jgi:hypothetical protein
VVVRGGGHGWGFVLQALALYNVRLSVVQSFLVTDLVFTLVIGPVAPPRSRRRLGFSVGYLGRTSLVPGHVTAEGWPPAGGLFDLLVYNAVWFGLAVTALGVWVKILWPLLNGVETVEQWTPSVIHE